MISILLALSAACSYGAADFLGGLATRRASVLRVAVPVQAAGLLALLPVLPLIPGTFSASVVVTGVAAGVCGGLGIALLYHALSLGKMGVVSPITAVLAAAVPVLAATLRGERLSMLQVAGIAVALAAVVLISLTAGEDGRLELSTKGVREAIASGVLLSGFYIFLAFAPHGGGAYPLLFARVASTALLAGIALVTRAAIVPVRGTLRMVIAGGVLDIGANGLFVAAAQTGLISLAAVLTSLYPAATVLAARVFLNERLRAWQTAGVLLALAGVAMISL